MAPRKKNQKPSIEKDTPEEEKKPNVAIQPFKRDLTVGLTREEVEERARKMSMLLADHDVECEAAKERAKRDKSKIKDMETELRRLGNVVRDKCELRHVACERRMNYETGRVTDYRLDTGEVLEERDMTDFEKQKGLPFPEPGDMDDEFDDAEPEDEAAE